MEMIFKITQIPIGNQKSYFIAYLEGDLKIIVGKEIFFSGSGILLIELALVVNSWLSLVKTGQFSDLIYESMDYNEPIISLTHEKGSFFTLHSIWQENDFFSPRLHVDELVKAFTKYLYDLSEELQVRCSTTLNQFI